MVSHSPLPPTRAGLHSQPIAYGICADFSLGKQQFYEKHEGVKIMSWSTTKEKSRMLLPSTSGTIKASDFSFTSGGMSRNSSAANSDATESSLGGASPVERVQSGATASAPAPGGWYSGLEVYLFRILTETSMSVGWGRMLRNKRVGGVGGVGGVVGVGGVGGVGGVSGLGGGACFRFWICWFSVKMRPMALFVILLKTYSSARS